MTYAVLSEIEYVSSAKVRGTGMVEFVGSIRAAQEFAISLDNQAARLVLCSESVNVGERVYFFRGECYSHRDVTHPITN